MGISEEEKIFCLVCRPDKLEQFVLHLYARRQISYFLRAKQIFKQNRSNIRIGLDLSVTNMYRHCFSNYSLAAAKDIKCLR